MAIGVLRMKPHFRDACAVAVVGVFMFPIIWWAYASIQPFSAIFNKDQLPFFNFEPTLGNYQSAYFQDGPEAFSARAALLHSMIIAIGSTTFAVGFGLLAAFGLSRIVVDRRQGYTTAILLLRFLPPIAIIIPASLVFRSVGLFDTHMSVIFMHATMNLPLAILMLTSFLDDVPREIYDAARIDGATEFQVLNKIIVPIVRGGIAATVVLCFIFSLIEFIMSLFLTVSFRTLPVTLSFLPWGDMGELAAASMSAIIPGFVFILIFQRHLVRGLTLGSQK